MKKIYILIITAFALSSCNDLLDEMPDKRLQEISTPEEVKAVLTDAYPKTTATYITELASDNIADNGEVIPYVPFFAGEAAYWKPVKEYWDYDGLHYFWEYHYDAISSANRALKAIEEKLGNATSLNPAKGEALMIRAYAHFCLANVFCKAYNPTTSSTDLGLPYMTQIEDKLIVKYPRGNVADFYQKIATDIEAGLPLIDDNYYQMPKYHFNKKAAYAFAARFFLYYQQWDKAIAYANVVLTENDATTTNLLRKWSDFGDATKIGSTRRNNYALYYTKENIDANLMLQPTYTEISEASYFNENNPARYIHNFFVSEKETLGARNLWDPLAQNATNGYSRYWFLPFTNNTGGREYDIVLMGKFPRFKRGSDLYGTIIVPFTTDETLIVRAEAKIMKNDLEGAIKDLNLWTKGYVKLLTIRGSTNRNTGFTVDDIKTFYNDTNMPYSQSTVEGVTQKKNLHPTFTNTLSEDQTAMLHYLLQCRRILTLGEGLRWQDIRRYNIEVPRYQKYGNGTYQVSDILTSGDLRNTFQLPDEVLGAGMEPNPR